MARLSGLLLLVAVVGVKSLGTPVTIEEYPSVAQVEVRILGIWVQQCAAAIITNYHVLSNAFCFTGSYFDRDNRRIRVGATNRNEGGDLAYVEHAYNHPYFGTLGKDGDLSVVRLYDSLILGNTIRQIPILGQGIDLPFALPVTNVGWGTTAQGGNSPNNQLYRIDLFTHNHERCMEAYQSLAEPEIVTENMICVGRTYQQGRDFDARDIGAPVIYQGTLVGLLSFGESDSDNSHPAVATNVGYFSDWIVNVAVD